ncbi:MAG: HD domain-containing protein [Deltaproteobacteria bacterium]
MDFVNPLEPTKYVERIESRDEDVRGPFFRDQTAIVHSMPFRRLKHKTQVFFSPQNDHICTRIEHALHVATISATIARALNLNVDMAYAIGLGHDLGHAPFGHAGEMALNRKCQDIGGFIHEINGLRVVDILGNRGDGLNLTYGVRDGIVCHCGEAPDRDIKPRDEKINLKHLTKKGTFPSSWEGCVMRIADRIAYLGRDLEDSIDGGFVNRKDVPSIVEKALGESNGEIINTLVIDIIETSGKKRQIAFSEEKFEVMMELYNFSVEKIYKHEKIARYRTFCERIIGELFDYLIGIYDKWDGDVDAYYRSPGPLDQRFGKYLSKMKEIYHVEKAGAKAIVRDYIAGMTDGYAIKCMKVISLPEELSFDQKVPLPNKANAAD